MHITASGFARRDLQMEDGFEVRAAVRGIELEEVVIGQKAGCPDAGGICIDGEIRA
jgi:hypothetical protein